MSAIGDAVHSAARAVSFERIVITGLFVLLFLDVTISFVLAAFFDANKSTDFVLSALKDIALMSVGALVASLRHKPNQGGEQ